MNYKLQYLVSFVLMIVPTILGGWYFITTSDVTEPCYYTASMPVMLMALIIEVVGGILCLMAMAKDPLFKGPSHPCPHF
jgi:Na+/proline symporter